MRTALIIAALALAGCSDASKIPLQPITIMGSDYCEIAEKIRWDLKDTKPTIDGVRRHNAKWDAKCGKDNQPTS